MSQITIIGPAYTKDAAQYKRLMDTAAKVGAPHPKLFGIGEIHPGDDAVIDIAIRVIRECDTPYVMGTDTYDTMFCRWDEAEIIEAINKAPRNVIYACEAHCWPSGEWCAAYTHSGIWRHANGGGCCGEREALADLFEKTKKFTDTANTQERLHRHYAEYRFGLDVHCRIFQSMSGPGHTEWQDGMVNTVEGTRPMLAHWNGRTPGIDTWYEKVMGS